MREMKCGVCGEISEFEDAIDFSKLEECDLGGQPNLSGADSYEKMVQCCKVCGYCNFDITENVLSANKLLQTENYQYILNSQDMDKSVANMAAVAYIYETENDFLISAKAHSYASKMCEQKGDEVQTLFFKEQEVRLLLMHVSTQDFKSNFDIKIYQYIIDALRRLRKFDKAIKFCDVALTKPCSAVQKNILLLEKSLCINFISEPHKFTQTNGEFGNFYQILIQGFSGIQNESVYKNTYLNMRSYLEKSVYFPIADGADFIMQVEETSFAGMDEMILALKQTYDKVRNGESEKPEILQVEDIKELTQEEKEAKILTLKGIKEENDAIKKAEELEKLASSLQLENQTLLAKLQEVTAEKETLLKEADILYDEAEKAKEELFSLREKTQKLESDNAILSSELDQTIQSRRELTASFDNSMYAKDCENAKLIDEIAILNELLNEQDEKNEINMEDGENTPEEIRNDTYEIENNQDVEITEPEETIEDEKAVEDAGSEETDEFDDFFENDNLEEEIEEQEEEQEEPEEEQEEPEELEEIMQAEEIEEIEEISQAEENNFEKGEEYEDMAEFVLDELTEEMILNIAQISGQIDVSEVQGMLLVGYKNAKYALDKIADDGKLQEISEDVYKYTEV
ncbi:MAG: hypothetical protein R3Y18_00650 [Bacillota bacterium]